MDDLCQIAIPLTSSGPPAEIQAASRTRGASNQPVAEQPYGLVSEKVWEGLETAIANGDRLPNDEAKLAAKVQRRALLVAVSYENNWAPALGNQFPPLLSTPNDVWRVYKMLIKKCHYDPSNIRILVPGFSEINMPTKANIMSSLQWLVHGVEEGHYRYFHFSGHGDVIESKEGEGKAAREIPEHENKINPKDTELFTRGARRQTQSNERILTQEIPRGELRYYNEAILTSWVAGGWRRWTAYDDNRIRDRELNEAFAKLPKGSTLTCTLDCCHSGRMLNTNYKLAGNGFRGGWRSSTGLNSPPDSPSVAWETSFSQPLSDIRDAPAVRGRQTQGASAGTQNYFSAPIVDMSMDDNTIKMVETLPDQERIMDKINATMLAWSASQQRQKAVDYGNKMGGHFTYAFTHTVRNAPDEITTGDLHRNVEDKMNSEGNHPQYCQLWTSLGDEDESRARDKLKQIFTI